MARRTAVYLIWCPELRPGPCYVGTSYQPRKRFGDHLKAAREGKSTGGADCIRAIWEAGHQPKLTVWKWFDTEREAKKAEARFKELVKSNPRLDPTNRHAGLETGVDSEARQRGGCKGAVAMLALKDADGKSVNARKGGRKGGRVGAAALKERRAIDPRLDKRVREGCRKGADTTNTKYAGTPELFTWCSKGGRISGPKKGALYGRDDLVRYIRKQDPGRGFGNDITTLSRELAAEIERDHGVRVNSCSIRQIWYGKRYTHVE